MSGFEVGSRVFVAYDGDEGLYHERLILGHVQAGEYMVMSPDADVYVEQLDRGNVDLVSIRAVGPDGLLPFGIGPDNSYRLPVIGVPELERVLAEGARLTDVERQTRGLVVEGRPRRWGAGAVAGGAVAGAAVAAAAPLGRGEPSQLHMPPELAPPGGLWVLDEPGDRYDIGTAFELPPDAVVLGDRALFYLDGSVSVLKHLPAGERVAGYAQAPSEFLSLDPRIIPRRANMSFAEAVSAMTAAPWPEGIPFPLQGPDTRSWFIDTLVQAGYGSPVARHFRWRSESGVGKNDRCIFEHEVLSRFLEIAALKDGLNLRNLSSVEHCLRRLQLIQEAVSEDPLNPSYEGARHFMGGDERRGGAQMAPSLRAFVATELGREAAILKEKRKARENRREHGGKGGGRGSGAAAPPAK